MDKRIVAEIHIEYEIDNNVSDERFESVKQRLNEIFDKESPSTECDLYESLNIEIIVEKINKGTTT